MSKHKRTQTKQIKVKHTLHLALTAEKRLLADTDWDTLNWELIYDPDGLYKPNEARFSGYDVEYGLTKQSFAEGTVLVNRKSATLLKVGAEL